eukprot:386144-Rhodomonas_salina.1
MMTESPLRNILLMNRSCKPINRVSKNSLHPCAHGKRKSNPVGARIHRGGGWGHAGRGAARRDIAAARGRWGDRKQVDASEDRGLRPWSTTGKRSTAATNKERRAYAEKKRGMDGKTGKRSETKSRRKQRGRVREIR